MRACRKCQKEYPESLEFFHRNSQAKDGLHVYCKQCRSEDHKKYLSDPEVTVRVKKKIRIWQKGIGSDKYKAVRKKYDSDPRRIVWRRNRKVIAKGGELTLNEALESLELAKREREANPITLDTLKLRPFSDGRNS